MVSKAGLRYIAVHPGQGAQSLGMALDFYRQSPRVARLFDLASSLSGQDMYRLLESGTEADLARTRNTQVAVALASRAAVLRAAEEGMEPVGAAGFSLGELPALVCAGVLDDEALFSILVERGRCMAQAVEDMEKQGRKLGMAAVLGLDFGTVETILTAHNIQDVYCANDNSPSQVVVAGDTAAIDALGPLLKEKGARRMVPLKVSGPFHTPLMAGAVVPFASFLNTIAFQNPRLPFVSSVTGDWVESGDDARSACASQLVRPVRWTRVMERLRARYRELGCRCLLETGPGKVLTSFWGQDGECPAYPAGTEENLQKIKEDMQA